MAHAETHHPDHPNPHKHEGGHPTVKTYLVVFGILMIGTLITVWAAFYDLGALTGIPYLNPIVALVIAVAKATVVILFFMHVFYSGRLIWLTVIGGFFWLMILLTLTMTDYVSRALEGVMAK